MFGGEESAPTEFFIKSEFLKKYHNKFPEIFRKSWAPYQKIADKKMQKNLDDFSKFVKE